MDRKLETAAVKRALIDAGFDRNEIRVTHGKGTAWGWLTVHGRIQHKPDCSCVIRGLGTRETGESCALLWHNIEHRLIEITQRVTGRHGEFDGRIGVNLDFFTPTGREADICAA